MNRRDFIARLAAAGLVLGTPETVKRFWPGWSAPESASWVLETGRFDAHHLSGWTGVSGIFSSGARLTVIGEDDLSIASGVSTGGTLHLDFNPYPHPVRIKIEGTIDTLSFSDVMLHKPL